MNYKKNYQTLGNIKDMENFKKVNSINVLAQNSKIYLQEQKETMKIDINISPNLNKSDEPSIFVDYRINNKTPLMYILLWIMK